MIDRDSNGAPLREGWYFRRLFITPLEKDVVYVYPSGTETINPYPMISTKGGHYALTATDDDVDPRYLEPVRTEAKTPEGRERELERTLRKYAAKLERSSRALPRTPRDTPAYTRLRAMSELAAFIRKRLDNPIRGANVPEFNRTSNVA